MNKPLVGILTALALLAAAQPSHATMPMQKKAKELGFKAENCLYCHNEKMPAKGKVTNNDRGAFLVAQKEAKKAKEVDMAWLKDYVEPKK
jgi:hypothetical protein